MVNQKNIAFEDLNANNLITFFQGAFTNHLLASLLHDLANSSGYSFESKSNKRKVQRVFIELWEYVRHCSIDENGIIGVIKNEGFSYELICCVNTIASKDLKVQSIINKLNLMKHTELRNLWMKNVFNLTNSQESLNKEVLEGSLIQIANISKSKLFYHSSMDKNGTSSIVLKVIICSKC